MRAKHASLGLVYWDSAGAPDPTGASSGYSPVDITDIVVVHRRVAASGGTGDGHYTTLAALVAALDADGKAGWLVNATSGARIWGLENRGGAIVPVSPFYAENLTANRWGRVASVSNSTTGTLASGHTLPASTQVRIADVSSAAGTAPQGITVSGTSFTLASGYGALAAGDILYESGTSEVEFGLDVLVAALEPTFDPVALVYATGSGIHLQQAVMALMLPDALDMGTGDGHTVHVGVRSVLTWGTMPAASDGGATEYMLYGPLVEGSGSTRRVAPLGAATWNSGTGGSTTTLLARRITAPTWPLSSPHLYGSAQATQNHVTLADATPRADFRASTSTHRAQGVASSTTAGMVSTTIVRWADELGLPQEVNVAPNAADLTGVLLGAIAGCGQWRASSGPPYGNTALLKEIDIRHLWP